MFYFFGIFVVILDEVQCEKLFDLIVEFKYQGCEIVFDLNYCLCLWLDKDVVQVWMDCCYFVVDIVFLGGDDYLVLYGYIDVDDVFGYFVLM